jgi:hypothetical protein
MNPKIKPAACLRKKLTYERHVITAEGIKSIIQYHLQVICDEGDKKLSQKPICLSG